MRTHAYSNNVLYGSSSAFLCVMREELKREEKARGSFVRCFALGHSERVCECVILSYKLLTNAPNDKFLYEIPIVGMFCGLYLWAVHGMRVSRSIIFLRFRFSSEIVA